MTTKPPEQVIADLYIAANLMRHIERAEFAGEPWATQVVSDKARTDLDAVLVATQQWLVHGGTKHDAESEVGHAPAPETTLGQTQA